MEMAMRGDYLLFFSRGLIIWTLFYWGARLPLSSQVLLPSCC
jgi:hypothetical protein